MQHRLDLAAPARPRIEAPPVIDVEASGFGKGSYPIEVGYVLADGRCGCMLIRPAPEWEHWDAGAERLHHIPREALLEYGRSVADVAERLNDALDGLTVYTDGWANDLTWLATLYDAASRRPSFKLESLMTLLSEDELERWSATKTRVFGESPQARHRASADARLLQRTVMRVWTSTA